MFFFENNKISLFRVLRYLFFVTLIIWILVSIPVFYTYIRSSSQEVVNKGGTFVEGIFGTTSYLPYLSNDPQSLFYQGLLFRPCLKYTIDNDANTNQKLVYDNDLCKVDTKDHKTYYVSVIPENTWSDGVPVALDDIFFTYKKILVDNTLGIKHLDEYSSISVSKEGNKIKVIFPQKNRDNTLFFTNYILPEHALIEPNIDMYQQSFALEPVYTNCAKIQSQSTDQYSLIFDLTQCKDTHIGFYQIKNLQSIDHLEDTIKKKGKSIIDAYENTTVFKGYTGVQLRTDKYITIFFNTQSPKLLVRTRRALGGLIHHYFNTNNTNKQLQKIDTYKGNIFNTHLSTGEDIKSFIHSALSEKTTNLKNIKDSGVQKLPKKINIKGTNQAYIYYTPDNKKKNIAFSIDQKYEKIAVQYNTETLYYPKSYNSKKKTFNYLIASDYENLKSGLNTYTIYGFYKKKKIKLASLKVYFISEEENNQTTTTPIEKITILYFNNKTNQYIINTLKKIFAKYEISEYFIFEGFDDEHKVQGALSNGEYDIFVGAIDASLKKHFYNFLGTDKAILNPSKYTNPKLISLLEQYQENNNPSILKEINTIYSNISPFIILGTEKENLAITKQTENKIINFIPKINLHEYNRRKVIYNNLALTKNIYFDTEGLLSFKNFYYYITQ
ncbi:MAG: hypothetical protein CR971_01585 [candidate division SR1 bacterium]|nr:MAG: hypothetical protein CR971_01585 [candidate division SR1 bacterium]